MKTYRITVNLARLTLIRNTITLAVMVILGYIDLILFIR